MRAARLAQTLLGLLMLLTACTERTHELGTSAPAYEVTALEPHDLSYASTTPLEATLVGPGGARLEARSFPDGGRQVIRLTATAAGTWSYTVHSGTRVLARDSLRAAPSREHGFIAVRGHDLVHADGTRVSAIGENRINLYDRSWNWHGLSIEEYIAHMARHGMSVVRVFIVSDVENEADGGINKGVLEPALGRFDDNVAGQFDRILRAAQSHGMSVILVAFALGFSEGDEWKSWHDNPYSAERGGPATSRFDFFASAAVRARAAERIR
jgi:hypothetical protein